MKKVKNLRKMLLLVSMTLTMMFAMCIMASAAGTETSVKMGQLGADSSSVKVGWQLDGVLPKYVNIQIATDAKITNVVKETTYTAEATDDCFFSGLNAGSTYYVRIGGSNNYSGPFGYTRNVLEVVTAPADLGTVSFVDADDYSATISWAPVAGATGYIVRHNPSGTAVNYDTTAASYKLAMTATSGTTALVYPVRKSSTGFEAIGDYTSVTGLSPLSRQVSTANFGVDQFYSSIKKISFGVNSTALGQGAEFELKPQKGAAKILNARKSYLSCSTDTVSFKKGSLYKYRVRMYVVTSNGAKKYGQWSDYRTFATANKMSAKKGAGKSVKLSWKKIPGLSKIVVKMSTSQNGKYTKVATLKGSATGTTLSKYKKKAFANGKTYYYQLEFYSKAGKKTVCSDVVSTGSFRWTTRYVYY